MLMNKIPVITKEVFLNTLKCPLLGWQTSRSNSSEQQHSLADQFRMEAGLEIGERARTIFPNGILIPFSKTKNATDKTKKLLSDQKINVLYEATFCWGQFVTKSDILKRNKSGWQLYEVKSAVNDKDELINDMAYTAMVAQKAGLNITNCSLLLVSKDLRLGMSNQELFNEIDHTEEVFERVKEFLPYAEEVEKIILSNRKPPAKLIWNCKGCERFEHCTGKDAKHHIFELPRLNQKQFTSLSEQKIFEISAISDNFKLSANQEIIRRAVLNNQSIIEAGLKNDLDSIQFPAYYLDFETVDTALPLYSDIAPYTQISTQYSLHKCSAVGKVINHYEYLADPTKDCRRELANKLINDCGEEGSILIYSSFEKSIVNGLIKQFTELAEPLQAIIDRMIDLCALIRSNFYHPEFCGSYSIKGVLPVLVCDMSYSDLDISDGGLAMAVFAYMAKGKYDKVEMKKLRENLLKYCEQDTFAMVKLHEQLSMLAK